MPAYNQPPAPPSATPLPNATEKPYGFTLPDLTKASYHTPDPDSLLFSLAPLASNDKNQEPKPCFTFQRQQRTAIVSVHGLVNQDRAESEQVWLLKKDGEGDRNQDHLWAAIYAFWIHHQSSEKIPIELDSSSISNSQDLKSYLIHTGLGQVTPTASNPLEILLIRPSFWQAAGASLQLSWLRSPIPNPSVYGTSFFPPILSFTKSDSPPVLTTHPLRPPKPSPGSTLYSRFIFSVGQHLTLTHIDGNNQHHFETYKKWQNSDRVNVGWREKGDDEKHRKYLKDRLNDPHIMGFMVEWDGELAGYGEISWVKEDGMNAFVGGMGDYDQGTHLLIGEDKFRGRHRFQAVMTAMKHAAFLREPRTDIVVGEPRADLPIIPLLKTYLPQEVRKEFELPHKRAVYFILRRERFFQEGCFN